MEGTSSAVCPQRSTIGSWWRYAGVPLLGTVSEQSSEDVLPLGLCLGRGTTNGAALVDAGGLFWLRLGKCLQGFYC